MRFLVLLSVAILGFSAAARAFEEIPEKLVLELAQRNRHQTLSELLSTRVFHTEVLSRALLASVKGEARDEESRLQTADVLLSKGAWVNYRDFSGATPFLAACEENLFGLAAYLLEMGADPDAKNSLGWTASIYLGDASRPSRQLAALMEKAREEKKTHRRLPIVMNFNVTARKKKIHATYDLLAHEISCVKLVASGDGGRTYDLPLRSVAGDVGCEVMPGRDLTIVWDIFADYPKGFAGREIKLDLVPYPRQEASNP